MPVVNKQTARPVQPAKVPAVNGSILASAVAVGDLKDDYVNFVLYGINRCGKTTLSCQFPKPLLLVSFEPGNTGGAASVKKVPGVKFLRITSKAMAIALAHELRDSQAGVCDLPDPRYNGKTYQTHVLDTCTSLQDMLLKELMGLENVPVQLNWGTVGEDYYRARSEQAKEVMRLYRDLPCNTVFVAQEKDHQPPQDRKNKLIRGLELESFFAADLGGATVKWMHDACDYIGRLYIDKETRTTTSKVQGKDVTMTVETGRSVRRLRTLFHPNYAAGFRSATPDKVPEYIEEPTWDKILKVIQGT